MQCTRMGKHRLHKKRTHTESNYLPPPKKSGCRLLIHQMAYTTRILNRTVRIIFRRPEKNQYPIPTNINDNQISKYQSNLQIT